MWKLLTLIGLFTFMKSFTHAKKFVKKKKKLVSLDTVDSEYLFNKVGQNKKTGKFAKVFLSVWGRSVCERECCGLSNTRESLT